eukprot:362094-Chlamydomonas_euryale.AAC.7
MGSNKVLQVALGRDEADEVQPNIHLLSERIKGNVGLLFTDMAREEVRGSAHVLLWRRFVCGGGTVRVGGGRSKKGQCGRVRL